ncbi:MAG: L-histidine N(alpha)-methyltransferase [Candidatus Marinimicrobia bacterium]|nr:L-histidine N(alpha)-methyltransferase [Candidatus Neomarinimicrobiota bacterium]
MNFSATPITTDNKIAIVNHLPKIGTDKVRKEIIEGLHADPKYISSKYFYNKTGSELFERITGAQEYYLTRTEKSILASLGERTDLNLVNTDIIELGSGDHSKINILLKQIPRNNIDKIKYVPVDINQTAIETAGRCLMEKYPDLMIHGVVADFFHQLDLLPKKRKRVFCFFGSTIGNFSREQGSVFCTELARIMELGDVFFLGLDMVKDVNILHRAYNDRQKLTDLFNKNILYVVNDLIGTDFDPAAFAHLAYYNEAEARIEMHLKALMDMEIMSPFTDQMIILKEGETIQTENSHKFTPRHIHELAEASELSIKNIFSDENNWFSLVEFIKT